MVVLRTTSVFKLVLAVGNHPDEVEAPWIISWTFQTQQQSLLSGISKEAVGQTAAYVRVAFKDQKPYKGKGIRY